MAKNKRRIDHHSKTYNRSNTKLNFILRQCVCGLKFKQSLSANAIQAGLCAEGLWYIPVGLATKSNRYKLGIALVKIIDPVTQSKKYKPHCIT